MACPGVTGASCKRRLTPGAPNSGGSEMRNLITRLYLLTQRDSGQTMAEYAVVLAVIAVGIFGALTFLSGSISGALDSVTNEI